MILSVHWKSWQIMWISDTAGQKSSVKTWVPPAGTTANYQANNPAKPRSAQRILGVNSAVNLRFNLRLTLTQPVINVLVHPLVLCQSEIESEIDRWRMYDTAPQNIPSPTIRLFSISTKNKWLQQLVWITISTTTKWTEGHLASPTIGCIAEWSYPS